MLKAFAHKAGYGPDPGRYKGEGWRMREGDEQADRGITDANMQRAAEEPFEELQQASSEAGWSERDEHLGKSQMF